MFANLTYQDKQAFFALLDEYFESRPQYAHMRGAVGGNEMSASPSPTPGGLAPPSIDSSSRPRSGSAASGASSSVGAGVGGRTLPPPVHGGPMITPPVRRESPAHTPASHSTTTTHSHVGGSGLTTASSSRADGLMGSAKSFASTGYSLSKTGVGKFAQNQHVSGAMGKIGASNFNAKLAKAGDKPKTSSPSLAGNGVGVGAGTGARYTPRTTGAAAGGPPQPPPSRGAAAAAKQGNRAQAMYDYDGGDETDLPVRENQMVSIIAKTSDDCE